MAVSAQQILLLSLYREGVEDTLLLLKCPSLSKAWSGYYGEDCSHSTRIQSPLTTTKTWSGQGHHPDQESTHSTPPGQCLFLNDPWTKIGFDISKWLQKENEKYSCHTISLKFAFQCP